MGLCVRGFVVCSMFLSRTVAAEVCMEAKSNEHAYAALKKLDHSGDLLFELSYVPILPLRIVHAKLPHRPSVQNPRRGFD